MESLNELLILIAVTGALVLTLILYIIAIVHIQRNQFSSYAEKARWLTLVIAAPVLGSILYFFHHSGKKSVHFNRPGW